MPSEYTYSHIGVRYTFFSHVVSWGSTPPVCRLQYWLHPGVAPADSAVQQLFSQCGSQGPVSDIRVSSFHSPWNPVSFLPLAWALEPALLVALSRKFLLVHPSGKLGLTSQLSTPLWTTAGHQLSRLKQTTPLFPNSVRNTLANTWNYRRPTQV